MVHQRRANGSSHWTAWFTCCVVAWSVEAPCFGATHYVNVAGTNPVSPFTSWETAATNIQAAVNVATYGDTVLVTDGVYRTSSPVIDRGTNVVWITNGISLQSVNGPAVTAIDGSNRFRCVLISHSNAVLDGFAVTRGRLAFNAEPWYPGAGVLALRATVRNCLIISNYSGYWTAPGGGIYSDGGVVSNCAISYNTLSYGPGGGGLALYNGGLAVDCAFSNNTTPNFGGGVYLTHSTLKNCSIVSNTGHSGAGVYADLSNNVIDSCRIEANSGNLGGGIYSIGRILITNCLVFRNVATNVSGGGIHALGINAADSVTISDCVIHSNRSREGGGLRVELFSPTALVQNCTFSWNTASRGGGAYLFANFTSNQLVFGNNRVYGNTATNYGGGLYGARAIIRSSRIESNLCVGRGGGAYLNSAILAQTVVLDNSATLSGGGAFLEYGATAEHCLFAGNTASNGGGVFATNTPILNCTISDNQATNGGGLYYAAGPRVENSVIYLNLAASGSNYFGTASNTDFTCIAPLPATGVGNTAADPLFVDALQRRYDLVPSSPCVDTGTNETWMGAQLDIDGKPRILNGTVDMGANELIPAGDSDGDGLPDAWEWDHAHSLSNMLAGGDEDGDHKVNLDEYRAGTMPTNGSSYIGVSSLNEATGLVISWQSVTGKLYTVSRTSNLVAGAGYQPIASDIAGQASTTVYTDTTAAAASPVFYNVGAQY